MQLFIAPSRARWFATVAAGAAVAIAATTAADAAPAVQPKPPPADAPRAGTARPGVFESRGDAAQARGKGPQATATQSSAKKSCTLRPDADEPGRDEWLSCLSVGASLDRVPEVGQEATLRIQVAADRGLDADVDVTLPPNLTWVRVPAQLDAKSVRSRAPETAGTIDAAEGRLGLQAGGSTTLTARVRAVAAGPGQIDVTAKSPTANGVDAGADSVFLTVRGGSSSSSKTITPPEVGGVVAVNPEAAVRSTDAPPQSVGTEGLAKPANPGAPCDTRVTGNWGYRDQAGAWHNSMNFQVQAWNRNPTSSDQLLASGITDTAGNYNLCFDSRAETAPESGTVDVYVRFVSENSIWRVQRGGSPLAFATGVRADVTPGSTIDFGSLTTADGTLHRGLHAFDEANDAWLWTPKPRNLCFDQDDTACRQLRINWAPDSTDGTYYSLDANDVHLAANDPNAAITVVHEIGHAIMDDVYNDAFPSAPNCNPHSIQGTSSAGCAWTEGFAEWFPATVYGDPFFRWPDEGSLDLENATWRNGWGEGDTTEGRIAGALIDLTDANNEQSWDACSEGPSLIWRTFMGHASATYAGFWSDRAADGLAVGNTQLGCLFQNTIQYGFREAAGNYGLTPKLVA